MAQRALAAKRGPLLVGLQGRHQVAGAAVGPYTSSKPVHCSGGSAPRARAPPPLSREPVSLKAPPTPNRVPIEGPIVSADCCCPLHLLSSCPPVLFITPLASHAVPVSPDTASRGSRLPAKSESFPALLRILRLAQRCQRFRGCLRTPKPADTAAPNHPSFAPPP